MVSRAGRSIGVGGVVWLVMSGACTGVKQHADPDAGAAGSDAGASFHPDAPAADLLPVSVPDALGPVERVVGSAPLGDAACAARTQKAERTPLDIYILFDSSASMTELTSAGPAKWDAVRMALTSFLGDPGSAGLGVGLQYFPLTKPGVPGGCAVNADCGASGPCTLLKGCSITDLFCNVNADCPRGERCVPLGACALEDAFCVPIGGNCGGSPLNTCLAIDGYCDGRDICDGAAYATPAVEVAALPAARNALVASLTAKMPDGLTPTSGALGGAITHAQALAKATPGHRVVVLLATDGFPSECAPTDPAGVAAIAAAGLSGTPSISTFVIGVFGADLQAEAQTNLNAIAAAGGTKQAFVINLSQNVTQEFLTALNAVRTAALSCEFKVPAAAPGETLDYYRVNVQYTSGAGQTVTIGNVAGKAACDPTKGGWYYDVSPASGGAPQNISICDTTCAQLRADAAGRVDVLLGCKTEIIVP